MAMIRGLKNIAFLCVTPTFSSVQSLSHVQLFVTPCTAVCQASLSITSSWSLFKFMSIESVMPSYHLIICRPLLSCLQSFPASGSFPMSQGLFQFYWKSQIFIKTQLLQDLVHMPPLSQMCIREHLVTLSGSRKELKDLVIQNYKKDYP